MFTQTYLRKREWVVLLHDGFLPEFDDLDEGLQNELLAHAQLIAKFGPELGRPNVDTLNGSRYRNMKELRFDWHEQLWRVAFAFDPARQAILLVDGNKRGVNQRRFYKNLITTWSCPHQTAQLADG